MRYRHVLKNASEEQRRIGQTNPRAIIVMRSSKEYLYMILI